MKIKDGVRLNGVQWQMFDAAIKAEAVYAAYGFELVITSGTDGSHMPTSLHYKGMALDFRTNNVPPPQVPLIHKDLRAALGPDYDVVLEGDHIHAEFDPKH